MIVVIAWRNVWRSRNRSLVVIVAITLGIWALTFTVGFLNGFMTDYLNNAITAEYSHLQIHDPSFRRDRDAAQPIADGKATAQAIAALPEVRSTTARTLVTGMVSSSKTASGVVIAGIDPAREAAVTRIDSAVQEGSYFGGTARNPVLISRKLAEKLGVRLKSKIVLTFQNSNGDITSAAFRIVGLFSSPSPRINEGRLYVQASDLNGLMHYPDMAVHEIAVMLHDAQTLPQTQQALHRAHPELIVESWNELAPELDLIVQQSSINQYILLSIIMIALAFSIVNTMLMAVLERVRELGMLMAVGMNRRRVFAMILLETVLLAAAGCPLGLLAGYSTMTWLGSTGIEFSSYSSALESFGYSKTVYPSLEASSYLLYTAGVLLTALLGSIYPAVRAIRLKPVEAIRTL